MTEITTRALEIAEAQVGQHENPLGSNFGHPVQDYLASIDIGFPASWCVAFLYWCFDQASKQLEVENPMYKTGGVLAEWNNRPNNHVLIDPQEGDVFIMDYGGGFGHTGIIKSVSGKALATLEGNSNNDGSRQGDTVVLHTRQTDNKLIKGYLRF